MQTQKMFQPCVQADRAALWLMPVLQVGLLAFFIAVALLHFWYDWWLLGPCFLTGNASATRCAYIACSCSTGRKACAQGV
jgi:fatty acid desaturase